VRGTLLGRGGGWAVVLWAPMVSELCWEVREGEQGEGGNRGAVGQGRQCTAPTGTDAPQNRDIAIFPRANRGLDQSWSDRWVLTEKDGFSDAFMNSDWLSTKFAAPVLIASRSDLKHPIMFRKPS